MFTCIYPNEHMFEAIKWGLLPDGRSEGLLPSGGPLAELGRQVPTVDAMARLDVLFNCTLCPLPEGSKDSYYRAFGAKDHNM